MALESMRNTRSTTGVEKGRGGHRAAAARAGIAFRGRRDRMALEIPLDKQRPNRLLFDDLVRGRGRRNRRAVNEPTGVNG